MYYISPAPFILGVPKAHDKLIIPAVSGVDYVRRGHYPQSQTCTHLASITDTHDGKKTHFTEQDWTDVTHPKTSAYYKSKTLAEKRAWDLIGAQTGAKKTELSVMNPTVVLGPSLSADIGTSNILQAIISGKVPAAANLGISALWMYVMRAAALSQR